MRADRPLIASIVFLATGLSLIFGYCNGATSLNAAFPIDASALHLDITTTGPAALGGIALFGLGLVLLIWALLAAIVQQDQPFSRQFQRAGQRLCPRREFSSSVQPALGTRAEITVAAPKGACRAGLCRMKCGCKNSLPEPLTAACSAPRYGSCRGRRPSSATPEPALAPGARLRTSTCCRQPAEELRQGPAPRPSATAASAHRWRQRRSAEKTRNMAG